LRTDLTASTAGADDALISEYSRLVRLCAHLTADVDAAEDLAQETLYEAWRSEHKLRDPAKRSQWLSGIARNVCLRWARKRARESARLVQLLSDDGLQSLTLDDWAEDDFDLDMELERDELAGLLDRAMALLQPQTRQLLIGEYVEETTLAETAARLGLSEAAAEKRLQRGLLVLRRVLTTDLREEAASYGLTLPDTDGWRETRIWCMGCGQHRIRGRFIHSTGEFSLRCPGCCRSGVTLANCVSPGLFRGVKGFKPALTRLQRHAVQYYGLALERGAAPCEVCGRPLPLRRGLTPPVPEYMAEFPGVHVRCPDCDFTSDQDLAGLALALPEVMRFWREHPRMRTVRGREVEVQGSAAIMTTFESVTDSCHVDVVTIRDTFETVGVYSSSGNGPWTAQARWEGRA
jgi:RNA polymerase sigma factor (sigma-70 family)